MPGNSAASFPTCSRIRCAASRRVPCTRTRRKCSRTILREHWLTARAVVGFFPCNSVDEEIEVYSDTTRSRVLHRLHHLRQQKGKPAGQPHYALSDFIAPKDSAARSTTSARSPSPPASASSRTWSASPRAHDDYNDILLKSLADRLAEASAEALHLRVRRELWGYSPEERLTNEQLIAEDYRGIRPAPGYPACPDHTEKGTLWQMLDVERAIDLQHHRELRHVSDRRGQRLVFRAPGCEVFCGRARSISTRRSTTRRARAGARPRRASG